MCSQLGSLVSLERGTAVKKRTLSHIDRSLWNSKTWSIGGTHVFLRDIMGAAEQCLRSEMIILHLEKQLNSWIVMRHKLLLCGSDCVRLWVWCVWYQPWFLLQYVTYSVHDVAKSMWTPKLSTRMWLFCLIINSWLLICSYNSLNSSGVRPSTTFWRLVAGIFSLSATRALVRSSTDAEW